MDLWKYSCIVFWCQNDALIHSGLILISLHFTFWPWHVTLRICFPSNKSHLTEQWIWWCSTRIRSSGRKKGYDHNRQMGADMTAASWSWSLDELTLHNSTLEFHRKVHTRLPNWRKMGQVKADVYGRHQFSNFRDYELTKTTNLPINLWLVSLGILGTRNGWESLNTMDSLVVHIKKIKHAVRNKIGSRGCQQNYKGWADNWRRNKSQNRSRASENFNKDWNEGWSYYELFTCLVSPKVFSCSFSL